MKNKKGWMKFASIQRSVKCFKYLVSQYDDHTRAIKEDIYRNRSNKSKETYHQAIGKRLKEMI